MEMREFCAETMFETAEGGVHSDICYHGGGFSEEHRKLFHDCLDEWLDKGRGSGLFYLGDLTMGAEG